MLVETLTCVQPAPSLRKSKKAAENHLQLAAAITLSTGLVCLPAHRSPRRAWLDLDPSASPDGALRSRVVLPQVQVDTGATGTPAWKCDSLDRTGFPS